MSNVFAELFVSLGIKGADQTDRALKNTKSGLQEVRSSGLAAKAAIVGVMYGWKRLTDSSNDLGSSLSTFAALTGQSIEVLQKWQYAGRQFGATNEDIASSFSNVTAAMQNLLLHGQMPAGFGLIQNAVGLDIKRLTDTGYVMGQLNKASGVIPHALAKELIGSFGVNEKSMSAMFQGAFSDKTLGQAPKGLSLGQSHDLQKMGAAWDNIAYKWTRAVADINLKHGKDMIKDVDHLTDSVIHLTNSLVTLSEKLKAIALIGRIFEGLSLYFTAAGMMADEWSTELPELNDHAKKLLRDHAEQGVKSSSWWDVMSQGMSGGKLGAGTSKAPDVKLEQKFEFNGSGINPNEVGRAAGMGANTGIKSAFYQISAQGQAN